MLDVLFEREPWFDDARALWQAHEEGRIVLYLAASSLTDIFYISRRLANRERAWDAVETCLNTFEFCSVDVRTLRAAVAGPRQDFEDNVLAACAAIAGLNMIITRDMSGFVGAPVLVCTPAEALTRLVAS